jgi:hypothetical protein
MKTKLTWSEKAKNLKPGNYEHYKGNKYKVLGVSRHSEILEELVIYQAQYGDFDIWARPIKMFTETINIEGKEILRFKYLDNK